MIHSSFVFPVTATRFAVLAILLAALGFTPGPVRAGADFIGGQANAEEDEEEDPELADGAFSERARAMQHWLDAREEERREMGVAHVYERPRAIVDRADYPRRGHLSRKSRKSSGSAHGRRSARPAAKSHGWRELRQARSGSGKRPAVAGAAAKAAAKSAKPAPKKRR